MMAVEISKVLVVGMMKTGTTIVASVLHDSLPGASYYMEPLRVSVFEEYGKPGPPLIVKILYEHWMERPFLLTGILRGEAHFRPDKAVAIVRDPRDGLISAVMYNAYGCVLAGARRKQVEEWIGIVREKETDPTRHSVLDLIEQSNRIFNTTHSPDSFFETFLKYSAWLELNRGYRHVLRYEDLVADNTADLAAYLGIAVSRSRDVPPGLQRVARTRAAGDWRRMMLPEDVAYWKERYASALDAHGYGDWDISPAECDSATGSDYIRRIADEAYQTILVERATRLTRP